MAKKQDCAAEGANKMTPETGNLPAEGAEKIGEESFGEHSEPTTTDVIADENGEIVNPEEQGLTISNPQFATPEEIARLPLANVTITKDVRTDRKTQIKRNIYSCAIVLDRITSIPLTITEAEYGLIVAESGRSYFPLQATYKAHVRFVKTVFENGNSQLRVDAFLSDSVRVSMILDPRSPVTKLYLKRCDQGMIPSELLPETRMAGKKAE